MSRTKGPIQESGQGGQWKVEVVRRDGTSFSSQGSKDAVQRIAEALKGKPEYASVKLIDSEGRELISDQT